jgi:hypothetical protein
MKRNMNNPFIASVLVATTLMYSCAKQESQNNGELVKSNQASTQINDYFLNVSDWEKISPLKEEGINVLKEDASTDSNETETCSTKEYSLTKTPEKLVIQNPAAGVLYPGSLIQGSGYLLGPGGLREVPVRKRTAMELVMDTGNEKNSIVMNTVNNARFQNAYAELIKNFKSSGAEVKAIVHYSQTEAYNAQQAALDLGFSFKYIGSKATVEVNSKSNKKERVFMVAMEQNAYTLSVVAPESPAGFFTADFTEKDLKLQTQLGNLGPDNIPLYVSSVTYGRMLLFSVKTTASKEEIQGVLDGSYTNGITTVKGKVTASKQDILNKSQFELVAYGGALEDAQEAIRTKNVNTFFNKSPSIESYTPISYVIRDIKNNSIAKMSETASYHVQECLPRPVKAWRTKIAIEKVVMHYTGASSTGEVYGEMALNGKTFWSHSRKNYLPTKNETVLGDTNNPELQTTIVDLPVDRKRPVILSGNLLDNDGIFNDESLGKFMIELGYDNGGEVLDERAGGNAYSVRINKNIEIYYSVKRLEPIYREADIKLRPSGSGGSW